MRPPGHHGHTSLVVRDVGEQAARTTAAGDRHAGLLLLVVERDTPGFERGRNLAKIGMHAQDTAELNFSDCRVPVGDLLGEPGGGFRYLVSNLSGDRLTMPA